MLHCCPSWQAVHRTPLSSVEHTTQIHHHISCDKVNVKMWISQANLPRAGTFRPPSNFSGLHRQTQRKYAFCLTYHLLSVILRIFVSVRRRRRSLVKFCTMVDMSPGRKVTPLWYPQGAPKSQILTANISTTSRAVAAIHVKSGITLAWRQLSKNV